MIEYWARKQIPSLPVRSNESLNFLLKSDDKDEDEDDIKQSGTSQSIQNVCISLDIII